MRQIRARESTAQERVSLDESIVASFHGVEPVGIGPRSRICPECSLNCGRIDAGYREESDKARRPCGHQEGRGKAQLAPCPQDQYGSKAEETGTRSRLKDTGQEEPTSRHRERSSESTTSPKEPDQWEGHDGKLRVLIGLDRKPYGSAELPPRRDQTDCGGHQNADGEPTHEPFHRSGTWGQPHDSECRREGRRRELKDRDEISTSGQGGDQAAQGHGGRDVDRPTASWNNASSTRHDSGQEGDAEHDDRHQQRERHWPPYLDTGSGQRHCQHTNQEKTDTPGIRRGDDGSGRCQTNHQRHDREEHEPWSYRRREADADYDSGHQCHLQRRGYQRSAVAPLVHCLLGVVERQLPLRCLHRTLRGRLSTMPSPGYAFQPATSPKVSGRPPYAAPILVARDNGP